MKNLIYIFLFCITSACCNVDAIPINGQPFPLLTSYKSVPSSYLLTDKDYTIVATGTITITLPSASNIIPIAGRCYVIKNNDAGVVTLAAQPGQTIDGSTTQAIQAKGGALRGFSVLTVQSTGSNF